MTDVAIPSVRAIGFREPTPPGYSLVDVTSRSPTAEQGLSPFVLGPVLLYPPYYALNVENAWQFCKVYSKHVDPGTGEPSEAYFAWAREGWASRRAQRYPMGKGVRPLYSWWAGARLNYLEARRAIYVPAYVSCASRSPQLQVLRDRISRGERLALRCFDSYDYHTWGRTFENVLADPTHLVGHAMVLTALLNGELKG